MKKYFQFFLLLAGLFFFTAFTADPGDPTTLTFKVKGNCGMCKERIEKAAKSVAGVTAAKWDVKSKVLTLTYTGKPSVADKVKAKIVAAGHDVEAQKAKQKTYEALPGCCQYERG